VLTPAFAEYEDACRLHGHKLHFLAWKDLGTTQTLASDLVFICNPNNPTGSVLAPGLLPALLAQNPATVFVLDEAFIEFTTSIESAIPLLAIFDNLLILRSLTKAYAIPGLRLGYVVAPAALVARLSRHKAPWAVNALAVAAGHYLFENYAQVQLPLAQLLADKVALAAALVQNPGLDILPSHTHYFLARTRRGTAAALKSWLLDQHGLLIRDASNFRGLTPAHFRLGTRHPSDNQLLIEALAEWTALPA